MDTTRGGIAVISLEKAMRILDKGEPWTIGTEFGNGWIFYFDGKEQHSGACGGVTLDSLLRRKCINVYEREERKYWSEEDRKSFHYMELEAGLAFIVSGNENGLI